jgi:hypothetical protein
VNFLHELIEKYGLEDLNEIVMYVALAAEEKFGYG